MVAFVSRQWAGPRIFYRVFLGGEAVGPVLPRESHYGFSVNMYRGAYKLIIEQKHKHVSRLHRFRHFRFFEPTKTGKMIGNIDFVIRACNMFVRACSPRSCLDRLLRRCSLMGIVAGRFLNDFQARNFVYCSAMRRSWRCMSQTQHCMS